VLLLLLLLLEQRLHKSDYIEGIVNERALLVVEDLPATVVAQNIATAHTIEGIEVHNYLVACAVLITVNHKTYESICICSASLL
jgi:hypothetical protein